MKSITRVSERQIKILQLISAVLGMYGMWLVTTAYLTVGSVISIVGVYYLLMICGISICYHRYWTHREFEFRHPILTVLFTLLGVLSLRGSPLAWVHIHRNHHAFADTEKDPHAPTKFKIFSFSTTAIVNFNKFLVKDVLSPFNNRIHDYYLAFVGVPIVALTVLVGFEAMAMYYFLPVACVQVSHDLWNYFTHIDTVGYRNYDTDDKSRNVWWLFPLIWGECWHNNHHKYANKYIKHNWWEIDPSNAVIAVVSK